MSNTINKFTSRYVIPAVLVTLILIVYGCGQHDTSFYAEKVSLSKLSTHNKYLRALEENGTFMLTEQDDLLVMKGHRITDGHGTVIGFRLLDYGSLLYVDDESYNYVTIFIPYLLDKKSTRIELSEEKKIIVFYSDGLPSLVEYSGCYGYAKGGYIQIDRRPSEKIFVEVLFEIDVTNHSRFSEERCDPITYKKSALLSLKSVQEGNIDVPTFDGIYK